MTITLSRPIRIALITLAALIGFTGLYSAVWFYQSLRIKTLAIALLQEGAAELGAGESGNFSFSGVEVYGYPFHFRVKFKDPRLIFLHNDAPVKINGSEPVVVGTNVLANEFSATLPQHLQLYSPQIADGKLLFVDFASVPSLRLGIRHTNIFKRILPWAFRTIGRDIADFSGQFRLFSYEDKGYTIRATESDEVLASSGGTKIDVESRLVAGMRQSHLLVDIAKTHNDLFELVPEYKTPLGVTSLDVDIAYSEPLSPKATTGRTLNVSSLELETEPFAFSLKGKVKTSPQDDYPAGELTATLRNHDGVVDYYLASMNLFKDNPIAALFTLRPYQVYGLKRFLKEISDAPHNATDESITIHLTRKDGDDLYIGEKTLPDVMNLFRRRVLATYSSSKPVAPATPQASAPEQPATLNENPAAGATGNGAESTSSYSSEHYPAELEE